MSIECHFTSNMRYLAILALALTAHAQQFWAGQQSYTPSLDPIFYVQGTFTVPRLTSAGNPLIVFVGCDGIFNAHVQQVGVLSRWSGAQQQNLVFYELYPEPLKTVALCAAGDEIFCQIMHFGNSWLLAAENRTQRRVWSQWFTRFGLEGNSAEWIVEGFDGAVPGFTPITFTECAMATGGDFGGIRDFDWTGVACNTDTNPLSKPVVGPLSPDRSSFTVTQ